MTSVVDRLFSVATTLAETGDRVSSVSVAVSLYSDTDDTDDTRRTGGVDNTSRSGPEGPSVVATKRHSTKTCRTCRNRFANTSKYGDPLGLTPPGNPRLPWPPIAAELQRRHGHPLGVNAQAQALGIHREEAHRWTTTGVRLDIADRISCHLGLHPADLWGDTYWNIGFRVCPATDELDDLEAAA